MTLQFGLGANGNEMACARPLKKRHARAWISRAGGGDWRSQWRAVIDQPGGAWVVSGFRSDRP
jgi:hypothetical protein